jgi:hypothetical protein
MKAGLFMVLSILYWVFAILFMVFASIGECGMGPDSPADCEGLSPIITGFLSLLIFGGLLSAYFRRRSSGVD